MKALIVDRYGPAAEARIGEIEKPKVKAGELLVRMRAAAINPFDNKVISGDVKEWMPIAFPYVPGMDGAGEVAEFAPDVTGWSTGDEVFGMFGVGGALAEYATVAADNPRLARKPDALDFLHAAALPEAGLTAMTILRAADLKPGQRVLIVGATGGIGLFATQFAKAGGAHVIATATANDEDYVRSLGAEEIVDYTTTDPIAEVRRRHPGGLDAVIDVVNTGEKLRAVADGIRDGGTLVSSLFGPDQSAFPRGVTVRYIQMKAEPGELDELAKRAASGQLHVEIGKTYPLSNVAQALTDLADPKHHTRGKLVVTIP
jgi:NADPH2:quinone reductase